MKKNKGKVLLTFDGGFSCHKAVSEQLLEKNLYGVFGVVADKINTVGYLQDEEIVRMVLDGHCIANHSNSYGKHLADNSKPYLEGLTNEEIIQDAILGKDNLKQKIRAYFDVEKEPEKIIDKLNTDYYIVPFGTNNLGSLEVLDELKKHFKWIRLTNGCLVAGVWSNTGNKRIYPGNYKNPCIGITVAADVRFPDEVKQKIEEACEVGGICVVCYHDTNHLYGEGQNIKREQLDSDIEFIGQKIKSEELECILPKDII